MNLKKKAQIKDKIVKHCIENTKGGCSITSISKSIDVDYCIVHSLTQDLISQGVINKVADITSRTDYTDNDMLVNINPRGRYYLHHEGGSFEQYKTDRRSKIWSIAKITAASLNAIVIVGITIWGFSSNYKKNNLENIILEKEEKINELNLKIDSLESSLYTIHHDSILNHSVPNNK